MDGLLKFDDVSWTVIHRKAERIDDYLARWQDRSDLTPGHLMELRQLATVQSVGSSTRIEGVQLQDDEIADLIQNLAMQKLDSRDEQEVAGYFNTLQIILDGYEEIPLSINMIKGLHKQLMQFSQKDRHHRGEYKTLSNRVVAKHNGQEKVIFQTTEPMYVADAMVKAIDWYNNHINEGNIHPLTVIGTFIYEFLTIHPFQDGNGRLSRLLTTMLLLKNGYEFVQYASLEQEIERYKPKYYEALMLAQRFRGRQEETIQHWLIFLHKAIERVTAKLDGDQERILYEPQALYLNRRQQSVLRYFERKGELSVGDIHRLIPELSRNTLKYDLNKLTKAGILVRKGKGRGTVYDRS